MTRPAFPLGVTPSQTVGPYYAICLTETGAGFPQVVGPDMRTADAVGEPIVVEGRVLDGDGVPVTDALVEIWQADGGGRYPGHSAAIPNSTFRGFGRSGTLENGVYRFATVKPGVVPGPEGRPQAPHVNVSILARGILKRIFTRIYFDDEPGNAADPILLLVPEDRRQTLVARKAGDADGAARYVLDIRLQGERETVFFAA